MNTEKRCYICKEIKPIESFNKNRSRPDGYKEYCRECQKIEKKKYESKSYYTLEARRKSRAKLREKYQGYCLCGCGEKVFGWSEELKQPIQYVVGHNGRGVRHKRREYFTREYSI